MRALILAASLIATVPVATAASAHPHGWHGHHRMCHTYMRHGHRVRSCH